MLLVSKYTSIKQLVYSQIVTALSIYLQEENLSNFKSDAIARVEKRAECKLLYRSSLALKMSKVCGIGVWELAANLASHLAIDAEQQWLVRVSESGWIEIEVMPGLIAIWLQSWIGFSSENSENIEQQTEFPPMTMRFDAQYAHARCCGLVRLAIREGLILPVDSEIPIPWCDRDMLHFQELGEWNFLGNLIDATDAIACEENASVQYWQRYAQNLSMAFESFWRECNIFGISKTNNKELALARLGLIMVAQRVLHKLLTTKLGQIAIWSL